jgi:hypothetical protein
MLHLRMQLRHILSLLLATALVAGGCSTTRQLSVTDLDTERPVPLRVTMSDGTQIELEAYMTDGTSLIGTGSSSSRAGRQPFNGRIPLERIALLEGPQASPYALLSIGVLAGGAFLLYIMQQNVSSPVIYYSK